jgi:hypothetical protein
MRSLILTIFVFLLLFHSNLAAQTLRINEVVSANLFSMQDEDGESPDWIELYNFGTNPINLQGFGLSDNENNPLRWRFPSLIINPFDYQIVFASGKDRPFNVHWETVIDWGDEWRYFVGTTPPPTNWYKLNFNHNNWEAGPSGFGYGDGDDATVITEVGQNLALSVFIRKNFIINDVNDVLVGLLHIDYDDAFVVWLNEVEIARENIGYIGNFPAYNELDDIRAHEAELYRGGRPNHYVLDDIQSVLHNGSNLIAIQVNTMDNDMTMIPFLTLGYATMPADSLYISPIVEPNLLNLHTNFSLSENEPVILADASGNIIEKLEPGYIPLDNSYGCKPDGTANHFFFPNPTPGISNNNSLAALNFADPPQFTPEGGIFGSSVSVSFANVLAGETIYVTLDGSEPNPDSTDTFIFSQPIIIDTTTVVRACKYKSGLLSSKVITNTYIIAENHDLPIVSLTTDPYNLWDYYDGIYVKGPNAGSSFPYLRANFWQDWEKPVHIELYEPSGELGFKMDGGIKIFGYFSRGHDQKSLTVFARGMYGSDRMPYKFFADKPFTEYKNIVFRNSGGDWMKSMMRDGLMQDMLQQTNLSYQAYRPCVIYINGVYWGIYNIREKINEHFFANNFGADPDNIDMLEENRQVLYGSVDEYTQFMNFVEANDLSDPMVYETIQSMMDVENYLTYQVAEILYCNTDWPGRNIKYWRERTAEAKWRWQIFDLDLGIGLTQGYSHNTLAFALEENGPYYPNPAWSTYLFRRMVENDQFVKDLINRFADLMNTILEPVWLENRIDAQYDYLESEMNRHFERWNRNIYAWHNEHLIMKYFARERKGYMTQYILEEFNIPGTFKLTLQQNPGGRIKVNSLNISSPQWNGDYFDNIPIEVSAIPDPGYAFAGWNGYITSIEKTLEINSTTDLALIAYFEPAAVNALLPVFNEINYNSSIDFNPGDWVEIHNPTVSEIDLSGWIFKDNDDTHAFMFPDNYVLAPQGFVVLCRRSEDFSALFPEVTNFLGDFDFGLSSNGEFIRLYDAEMTLIDSVFYGVSYPWATEPNGNGQTLSLKNPKMDNSLPGSWSASQGYGTPGAINDNWEPYPPPMSDELILLQNFPNPFNIFTIITYSIPTEGKVKLAVYNVKGQLVDVLIDDDIPAGTYEYNWNAKNSYGKTIASGLYLCQLTHLGKSKYAKLILLK